MTALRIEDHFQGADLALAHAAAVGDADAIERAVGEGASPGAVSGGGLPLVAWPILQGNAAGVRALLARGADPDAAAPGVGRSIVWAAKAQDSALLAAFLDAGADANAFAADGNPLLKTAALAGRWDNVQLLVERGARIDAHPQGAPGDTVLHFYSAGQFDKVLWLLENGADPSHRLERAAAPSRVGAQPVIENIFWWPVDSGRFPRLAEQQRQSQQWLADNGHAAPTEPAHLARLRERQGGAAPERAIDADIRDGEQALKQRMGQ